MALINVDKNNLHIQHLLKHMPKGKWDIYQLGSSPTEVLIVSHEIRDHFGYQILDALITRIDGGVDVLAETAFSRGWLVVDKKQEDSKNTIETWLEQHRSNLGRYALIHLAYLDEITLRYVAER